MKIDKQKLSEAVDAIYGGFNHKMDFFDKWGVNVETVLAAGAITLSDILPHLEEMIEARSEFSERLGASNDDAEFIFAADCAPKLDEIINILEGKSE